MSVRPAPDDAGPEGSGRDDVRRRGATFWVSAIIGWTFIGWGLRGIFHHHLDTQPDRLARFFVGGALIHDLVPAPTVLLLGIVIARLTPRRWRSGVQTALLVGGCLALFSYPEVRGYAHSLHNPTSLPYNYTANLAVSIGAVFAVMIAAVVVRRFRARADRTGH